MGTMASQITGISIVYSTVCLGKIKENIKALRHCPLWGESIGDWWIPSQKASNAENVSIWWRHHETPTFPTYFFVPKFLYGITQLSSLVLAVAFHLHGAKPLSEPMMIWCQLDP